MLKEEELLAAAKLSDRNALALIYDEYQALIYAYAYRSLLDADAAEDCTAAVFERLLTALQKGRGPRDHLRAYLFRMAHNWIVDWIRKENRQTATDFQGQPWPSGDPLPEDAAAGRMQSNALFHELQKLTLPQREVLVLRFIHGFSLHETARLVRKPVGAVKALQNRALAGMRRGMERKPQWKDNHEKKG